MIFIVKALDGFYIRHGPFYWNRGRWSQKAQVFPTREAAEKQKKMIKSRESRKR